MPNVLNRLFSRRTDEDDPVTVRDGAPARRLPGIDASESQLDPRMESYLLMNGRQKVDEKTVKKGAELLAKYKNGKANLEQRIVEDELWWELRHWEAIGRNRRRHEGDEQFTYEPEPTSAWLFNAIMNKHADIMDNYPQPVVLPREASDEQSAKDLSQILPVVLNYNRFKKIYDMNSWEKLKHGTAVYGVFWNSAKENGLGDIDITMIDLLNIFWEPGITDIQKSGSLFITELVETEKLEMEYPELKGKVNGSVIDVKKYIYDDNIDTSDKTVVVDWYYKVKAPGGKTLLHYIKFVGNELLYASENDPEYRERGYYDHGQYPVVFDTLFPEKGTPVGFGYIAICKDPQLYIDKLSGAILKTALIGTKPRFFVSESTAINIEDFLDQSKPIVNVAGELSDSRLQQIQIAPPSPIYTNILQMKIEEMKDTASNRDVNSGAVGAGITAAAAIAALQEAGNKVSRDMIATSYEEFTQMVSLVIELMRQFYTVTRTFRITQPNGGGFGFVEFSNAGIAPQVVGEDADGVPFIREPIFDLEIKAQKNNPFSRMEENERAKELYAMGFFNPERAQEALGALEMMDFEQIDKVKSYVGQGQTLLQIVNQLSQLVSQLTGVPMGQGAPAAGGMPAAVGGAPVPTGGNAAADGIMEAQSPMTGYGQRLAKRSAPDMDTGNGATK